MRRTIIGSVMAALCLAVALPAQGKGKGKGRKSSGAKVRDQVGPKVKVRTRVGHTHGKAVWKAKHPRLALELGEHPHLHAHLQANPRLFAKLRLQVDLDHNGVLDVHERGRFLVLLRASHAKHVPPGHTRGKAWWKKHHPALALELEKHPRLYLHLIANPGLYPSLRVKIGLDGNGKLSARERGHFVAQLRKHHDRKHAHGAQSKDKVSGARRTEKRKAKSKHRGKGKKR